jgi:hypothetical protein
MTRTAHAALLSAGLLLGTNASGLTINFDGLAPGVTLSTQYAPLVIFSRNAFSGKGSSSSGLDWATNSDMTIVSIVSGTLGVDYGALGKPSLVHANILHHFSNWQYLEDGDPSFLIELAIPASAVSIDFAGVGGAALAPDTRMFAYDAGGTLLGMVAALLPNDDVAQLTLSVSAPGITRIKVAPGSFDDWVGVDNLVISFVPEPTVCSLIVLGLAAAGFIRRRREP